MLTPFKFKKDVFIEEKNNIVIYQLEDGKTKIDVKLEDEKVWLSQQQMADLYDTTISLYIKNIFDEEELDENSTCAKIAHMVMMVTKLTIQNNIILI